MPIHVNDKGNELRPMVEKMQKLFNASQSAIKFTSPKVVRAIIISAYNYLEGIEPADIKDFDNLFKTKM